MEIWMIAGVLFGIALFLFVFSLIKKEEKEPAYKELENFSLSVTKTVYDLNLRVHKLEQELKIAVDEADEKSAQLTRLLKDNIITLFTKGTPANVIADQLDISSQAVQEVINDYITDGLSN